MTSYGWRDALAEEPAADVGLIATYLRVTAEQRADADALGARLEALLEFELRCRPPTLAERIRGRQRFAARNGDAIEVAIGWRLHLEARLRELRRQARRWFRLIPIRRAVALRVYDWRTEED